MKRLPSWNPCVLLGKPAIFTEERLGGSIEDILDDMGYDLVDIRHRSGDLTCPVELKPYVLVDFFGTAIFPTGSIDISHDDTGTHFLKPDEFLAEDYEWDSEYEDVEKMAEKIKADVEGRLEDVFAR